MATKPSAPSRRRSLDRMSDMRWALKSPDHSSDGSCRHLEITGEDERIVRIAEVLQEGRPLLLDLGAADDLAAMATKWKDRVRYQRATLAGAPAAALLIRPDGYVAWSGRDAPGMKKVLETWFGDA
jgi:hypothetical protein